MIFNDLLVNQQFPTMPLCRTSNSLRNLWCKSIDYLLHWEICNCQSLDRNVSLIYHCKWSIRSYHSRFDEYCKGFNLLDNSHIVYQSRMSFIESDCHDLFE